MFDKLLALAVHGKSAMVAGVFVAGTSGLLVSGAIDSQNLQHTDKSADASADKACNTAAHARNDALHALTLSWDKARGELKLVARAHKADLRTDASAQKSAAGLDKLPREGRDLDNVRQEPDALTVARQDLDKIRHEAKDAMHAAADLGRCADDDDKDEAGAAATKTQPALDMSTLEAKYREILDKAVLHMQTVVEKTASGFGLSLAALQTQQQNEVDDDEDADVDEDENDDEDADVDEDENDVEDDEDDEDDVEDDEDDVEDDD